MPKRQREIPHHSELIEYGHAVAGHDGTMCDESGEFFFKPVHQQEIDFYESAFSSHPEFASVMPLYHGTLTRGEPTAPTDSSSTPNRSDGEPKPKKEKKEEKNEEWVPNKNRRLNTHQYLVLENASKGYKHANILDAKLGYRLWSDDAPRAKKNRFDKIAEETTHKNFGFRIAGMRIYRANAPSPPTKEGVKPAFEVDGDYNVYDRDYGRNYVNDDNLKDALRSYVFNEAAGIDEELGKAVCAAFVHDLERIRDALENDESRMFSASCLFVLEGDGPSLRKAIEENNARVERINKLAEKPDEYHAASRQDSGIYLEEPVEEAELVVDGYGDGAFDEIDDEEEERVNRACGVYLIDFAHAEWTPGRGPDENSLQGVRSLISIFREFAS